MHTYEFSINLLIYMIHMDTKFTKKYIDCVCYTRLTVAYLLSQIRMCVKKCDSQSCITVLMYFSITMTLQVDIYIIHIKLLFIINDIACKCKTVTMISYRTVIHIMRALVHMKSDYEYELMKTTRHILRTFRVFNFLQKSRCSFS